MRAIDFFELNIRRSEGLLQIHRRSYSRGRPSSTQEAQDVLRAVIVFSVSAFDSYLHMRVTEVVRKIMYKHRRVPEKAVSYITKSIKDDDLSRQLLNLSLSIQPEKRISHLLEKSLSGTTFQKPQQVEIALRLMEIKEPWRKIDALSRYRRRSGRQAGQTSRTFLTIISNRRDDIVHEGDVYVSNRYHGKMRTIGRKYTADSLKRFRKIVSSIEKVSEEI